MCVSKLYTLTYVVNVKGGALLLNGFQFLYLFTFFSLDLTKTRVRVETSCRIINLLGNFVLVVTENFIDIMTITEAEMFHIKCKKLTVSQLVKKFPAFYGTRRFTTARPGNCSLP
jgi:hypothetical protein